MKTIFIITNKKYTLKYQRKMSENEVIKMKSFITDKGYKLVKTPKFRIKKVIESQKERFFELLL
tara:strand:- start:417 stop:608 length:192 start_codon:yes stop_codon:yes gene_type:complete